MNKKTALQTAIEQIRTQAEDYQKTGNYNKSQALFDSINLLQSLLPVEREAIEDAYKDGFDAGTLLSDARAADYDSAQHYFNSKYESI